MRIFNGIFIFVFMAMLSLPLIFVDLSPDRVSVQENRMLAKRPELADIKHHPETFIREFDAWFKDSTGFRDRLVTLYNDAMSKNRWLRSVRYFDGQYISVIGEEGHIYYVGEGLLRHIEKFQGKQFLTDDQLANMATKLDEVKIYLDSKSIPLIVMFCTDKETIYPEFFPKSIKRGPEPIQLDVITGYLREHTTVDVFNIRQALLAEKSNFILYNVSSGDTGHYNEIGAFFTYRELMRHINIYLPEIVPYEIADVYMNYDENEITNVSLMAGTSYRKLASSFFDDVNVVRPFSWENGAYENEKHDSSVILFLSDSYSAEQYIGKYFANHFGKAIFINYRDIEHIEEYIDRYKPDIVVFESAERELDGFANYIDGIPKLP